MRKNYSLLSIAKQGLLALSLTMFSKSVYSQTTYTFNYSGTTQSISLPAGSYSIQSWGADGGNATDGSVSMFGGKGGYASGVFSLATTATINVYVGGHGGNATGNNVGGGGGGMSDIAPATNTSAVIIVAAGGGGAAAGSASESSTGGDGGGLTGGTAIDGTGVSTGTAASGGSQTAGGIALAGSYGAGSPGGYGFGGGASNGGGTTLPSPSGVMHGAGGIGGNGGNGGWNGGGAGGLGNGGNDHAAGGGAGYYGGGGGRGDGGAGGGGSSYIGGVSSGVTYSFGQTGFLTNPDLAGNGRVHIIELCNITLSVSGVNGSGALCSGNTVTITTNAVNNYSWSTGATSSSLVLSPTANTIISLTAQSASLCTATASASLIVSQGVPTLNIVNSTAGNGFGVCPNNSANLSASGAVTYSWTGNITNGVSFVPTVSSDYTVTGENGCGTGTAVTSVSIHPNPTISPISVSNPTMCTGTSNTLTASGVGVSTFSWSTNTVTNSIIVSPSTNTTYTVRGISAQGCTNTAVTTVTVFTTPVQVPVANPAVICLGNSSTLTAVGTTFTWSPGGAGNSSLVVTPLTSGVSVYTVTKANGACADTKTLAVTVNSLPVIVAQAGPTIVCATIESSTLTGTGGTGYTWTPSGGTGSTAIVNAGANTIFTLTGTNGNCISSNTVLLSVNPLPVLLPTASTASVCAGGLVTLSVTGASSYTWSPGGPFPFISVNPTITTQYNVVGTSSAGCNSSASITVVSFPIPTLNIVSYNPVVCPGGAAALSVSGADTYLWSNNATGSSATVIPMQSTLYSVTGTFTNSNCNNTQTVMVNVFTPSITASGNTNICEGETATLTANATGAISYGWSTGLPIQSIIVSPPLTSIYIASATVSAFNIACVATTSIQVTVNVKPTIAATGNKTSLCVNEPVTISGSGGNTYSWSWNLESFNGPTVVITPSVSTNLIVNVVGTGTNGCTNSGSVAFMVSACTGINETVVASNLSVYPNPSQGEINISLEPTTGSVSELLLISQTGQIIQKLTLNEENHYKVSIQGLSNGLYFITGQNGTETISKKVIVSR